MNGKVGVFWGLDRGVRPTAHGPALSDKQNMANNPKALNPCARRQ